MNKNTLLAKMNGSDLKHKRSLHKPWCDANGSLYLAAISWSVCDCKKEMKEQSQ